MCPTISLNEGGNTNINRVPDTCPVCHSKISPIQKYGKVGTGYFRSNAQIVFVCPNTQCNEFFIAYYESHPNQPLQLKNTRPIEPMSPVFEESIRLISPSFCSIYEEAFKAEQYGLTEVCGVGYRKSIEFLIKDYLIRLFP
jgi:hypothetical protein